MSAFFRGLLNLSITASWLLLAVLLARLLLRKAPKRFACLLWALAAVRLCCPFSIESSLSLIPRTEWLHVEQPYEAQNIMPTVSAVDVDAVTELYPDTAISVTVQQPEVTVRKHISLMGLLPYLWLAGVLAMLGYALAGYLRLRKSVAASVPVKDNILVCDEVQSPFLLGMVKPLIYLPSSLTGENLHYVITHEEAHIRRHDHWWKPLGYFLHCVYWFHPLVWLGYILFCRDLELACDEAVIRGMDDRSRAGYSQALLDCAIPRRRVAVCPLAFGEVGVKARVKNVLCYRKPAFWLGAAAVIACILIGVCFLTGPKREPDLSFLNYENAVSAAGQRDSIDVIFCPFAPTEENGLICIGSAEGNALARYLDGVSWKQRAAPGQNPASPGSVEFILREDYRITVWQKPRLARVTSGTEARWYRTGRGNFEAAAALFRASGEQMPSENAAPEKWFDFCDGDDVLWDAARETTLPEFPGVIFRCTSESLEAVTAGEPVALYYGMPILSVCFCDLNGDGLRELCSTVCFGSGIIDEHIIVFDYAHGAEYSLWDRGHYDYRLSLHDGQAWAEKRPYMGGDIVESGPLTLRAVAGADGEAIPMLMLKNDEAR